MFVHIIEKKTKVYTLLGDLDYIFQKETAVIFLTTGVFIVMATTGLRPNKLYWTLGSSVRHD